MAWIFPIKESGKQEITREKQIALSKTNEMIEFYRALAAVQFIAIQFVQNGSNLKDMKIRAVKATKVLQMMRTRNFHGDCPPPSVWNPVTETCDYSLAKVRLKDKKSGS